MAQRPINVVIKGQYTDADVKRAIRDLNTLQKQGPKTAQSISGVSRSFKMMGAGLVAGFGIAGIARGFKSAIDAGSALQESQSKVNVVFGDSANIINQWARTASTSMVMSEQAALEAAGTYGNLFQAFGVGQQQATQMSKTLVQLAADLASFNNTSTEDAIIALRSGLSGETEPLKRYGVALTDARLKAEAMAMGIYDGKGALDAHQKSLAAYKVILKDTTLAQGDVARTSDNYANQMRSLSSAVENASAEIGIELVPSISDAIESIGGAQGLTRTIEAGGDTLADFAAGISNATSSMLEMASSSEIASINVGDFLSNIYRNTPGIGLLVTTTQGLIGVGDAERDLNDEVDKAILLRQAYSGALNDTRVQEERQKVSAQGAADAVNALNKAMQTYNSANRSTIQSRIDLRTLRREGIQPSGGKKGKITTADDARSFGLQYASEVENIAQSLVAQGRYRKASSVLSQGREYIASQVGGYLPGNCMGFANRVLGTPPELRGAASQQASAAGAREWQKNAAPIYQTVTITVESPAQASATAMNLARLAKNERGLGLGDVNWQQVAGRAAGR